MRSTSNRAAFRAITYRIEFKGIGIQAVEGYAFETPGWPEFRACVRWGNRWGDEINPSWIVDHYDTGLRISLGRMTHRKEAPAALCRRLDEIGREQVHRVLRRYGLLP